MKTQSQTRKPGFLDLVEWTSQSGGFTKTKRGVVVAVVKAGERPDPGTLRVIGAGFGSPRSHESYLVKIGNVAYWPVVRNLTVVSKTKQKHMTEETKGQFSRDYEILADKELRVALDANLQLTKKLPASRERALAITKIQEAIMWLGMDLKRLAAPDPYPDSMNPSNTIIQPTADGLKM